MKKVFLFLMAYFLVSLSVDANPIGKQQAQAIAQKFLTERGVAVRQLHSAAKNLTKAKADGSLPYYVFNNGQNGGFVIVAGDDRAPSILGYSYTGTFGEEQIPENISSWLNTYAEQVEVIKENGKAPIRTIQNGVQQSRISISPLVMSHWNQYAPYFNNTPTVNGKQCLTGCVATAFAQVMKYYEWPKNTTTEVPGYTEHGKTYDALPATTFDWSNMLYNYQGGNNADAGCNDNNASQEAVAKLMVYCGYSVEAEYGTSGTSAPTSSIPYAMKNYFGYQGNINYVDRTNFSTAEWDDLIYNEIYNERPVIYSGRNSDGGHAFICDGYGEDGYFHVNWGWGGMSDGYYLLSILEPDKQGAGGTNSGYTQQQAAVIGIQPKASEEEVPTGPCLGILNFQLMDYRADYVEKYGPGWFGVGFQLKGLMDGQHQLNAQLIQNGEVKYEGDLREGEYWGIDIGVGHYNPYTIIYPFFHYENLADGTYEVRLVCRMKEEGKEFEWVPCQGSEKYHNEVTINGNSVIYNNTQLTPQVTCNSFTTAPTIYVNNRTNGVASLSNEGDASYQDFVYLWINDTRVASDMAYIDAGKTIDMSFSFTPSTIGSNTVKITTDARGSNVIYEGTINVVEEDANAAHQLQLTKWTIDNLDTESGKICGGVFSGILTVTNVGNKTYSGPIGYGFLAANGGGSMSYRSFTLAPGESVNMDYTIDDAVVGTKYRLVCWEDASFTQKIGETPLYELIADGYTYWVADGTAKSKAVSTTSNINVVSDAVAVKFFTTPTGTITPNANPNTLYYLSGSTTPSSLSGKNVVLNGHIDNVSFTDGYCFYVPLGFMATNATYSRVPKLGANGSSGWETIVLPFAAKVAFNMTDNKQIYWFLSRTDDDKDFWLKSFAYTDGEAVYFDYVKEIRANVPYIIATPGDKWGKQYDLRNKTIAFKATDVKIPQTSLLKAMTDAFDFVGLSEKKNVNGYVLDETGKYFVNKTDVSQDAFRAYFTINADNPTAYASMLRIGSFDADAIEEEITLYNGEATVYSLSGMKVGTVKVNNGKADINHLPNGVYIINGKKMMK